MGYAVDRVFQWRGLALALDVRAWRQLVGQPRGRDACFGAPDADFVMMARMSVRCDLCYGLQVYGATAGQVGIDRLSVVEVYPEGDLARRLRSDGQQQRQQEQAITVFQGQSCLGHLCLSLCARRRGCGYRLALQHLEDEYVLKCAVLRARDSF